MYFDKIYLDNIIIKQRNNLFYDIKYNSDKLIIGTPELYIPFGLEKNYNDYILKLQFRKTKNDIEDFNNFIKELENILSKKMNKTIKSKIITNSKYDDIIITKLIQNKNKDMFVLDIYDSDNNILNIFTIKEELKGSYIKANIILDILYVKNDICYYSFKLKEIFTSICV